jgi:putative intracellular protease/amidase
MKKYLSVLWFLIHHHVFAQQDTVLMFVSYEQTYYSEYIVMLKALQTAGYAVDVRSAGADSAGIYMIPSSTNIEETANTLAGSSYTQFTTQFQSLFEGSWNPSWNDMPSYVPVNGTIQSISGIPNYAAMVIVGGTGAIDYRVDGVYGSQGSGGRLLSSATIQAAAEKLNALALEFLLAGKPVMAQCHASSLPVFWRIPGTSGSGDEALGYSLLKDQPAAGFPEGATATTLSAMDVTYREYDRVTVSSPHSSFNDQGNGAYKIITTRDWYPQTVAHAARTLLNILSTYPSHQEMGSSVSVLILHGGAVNTSDCSYLNRSNDIPCNYGGGGNIPADYTDLQALLNADSPNDPFSFTVADVNMTSGSLPYTASDQSSVLNYFNQFDVVIVYKHWSTGMTNAIQHALVSYADNGGGVIALHHGLYNDIDGSLNKDILVDQLFGAESAMNTWSANLSTYNVYSTDHGHFVSTFGITFPDPLEAPAPWSTNALSSVANNSYSYYQRFSVYDEIYNNMSFNAGQTFGRGMNEINPIFSNDQNPSSQSHTTGFVKHVDPSGNGTAGKAAYFQIGERKESINSSHRYGQVIRNTAVWMASPTTALPVELISFTVRTKGTAVELKWRTVSEVNNHGFEVERRAIDNGKLTTDNWINAGFVEGSGTANAPREYSFNDRNVIAGKYSYRLKQIDRDGKFSYSSEVEVLVSSVPNVFALEQNYPNPFNPSTTIGFTLQVSGLTTLKVYDAIGREVATLVNEYLEAGVYHQGQFKASHLASGIYFARLQSGDQVQLRKIMLMK